MSGTALVNTQLQLTSAMTAYQERMRVVAQNLANARPTGNKPGEDPYGRLLPLFETYFNRASGENLVRVKKIIKDKAPFREENNPSHPAANERGLVKLPNVEPLVEVMDANEASQGLKRLMKAYRVATQLRHMTLNLLKRG